MLRDADTAMYKAKGAGKARYALFDASLHTEVANRLRLEGDLRRAIDEGRLKVAYQPVHDLADGRLAGFEALVRWQHPQRGLLYPAEFIDLAEETGLIVPLGWWVLLTLTGRMLGAEFSVEALGFGSTLGTSVGGGFTMEGRLVSLSDNPSTAGNYRLRRSLGNAATHMGFVGPDTNLLPFGDAEGIEASERPLPWLPGWEISGDLLVTRWGTPGGWPLETDPGPPDRGLNFFAGGPDSAFATATYRFAIPLAPGTIDAGRRHIGLSGWFGGFLGQADTGYLAAKLIDASGLVMETLVIGGVTPDMRTNRTGLVYDSTSRRLPAGARSIEAVLTLQRSAPIGWNDGYADNLRLAIFEPAPDPIELTARFNVGAQLEMAFPSTIGTTYTIEWLDAAEPAAWAALPGSARAGTGEVLRYELPVDGSVAGRFYRLRADPTP